METPAMHVTSSSLLRLLPALLSVLLVGGVVNHVTTQSFLPETCSSSPRSVTVEPKADVTIGAILPIHSQGEGVYGCSHPTAEGVQVYEAMRWAVQVLNRDSGLVSGSGGSLVPGVKIGLRVYDSCGHEAAAVEHLTSLFPVLRSGPLNCGPDLSNSSMTIGVVDMTQVSSLPHVADVMRDYFIPSISLSLSTVVSADHMAQVVADSMRDMHWEKVVVVHVDDEYSIHVTKILTHIAGTGRTCITSMHSLPALEDKSNQVDFRNVRRVLQAATNRLPDESGVVVISQGGESVRRVLQVMAEMPHTVARLQWFFTWIPAPTALVGLGDLLTKSRIFSLAPFPDKVNPLETYWSTLAETGSLRNPDDRWFLEYVMFRMGCRLSGFSDPFYRTLPVCSALVLREMPLDVLLRTSRAVPALTAIFTLAHAFHKAWEVKCHARPGLCAELRHMSRREFVGQFLEPVEFLASQNIDGAKRRSPRMADPAAEDIESTKLALTKYSFDPHVGVDFTQVTVYDGQGMTRLANETTAAPSLCPPSGCRGCVRPRQSRLEESSSVDDDVMMIGKPEDVIIPLLLPIREPGSSPLECGEAINPEAVQDLEAALWTVDKINSDRSFLAGVKLGVALVDTCSSPLVTTQKLATFLMQASRDSDVDINSAVAFVSAASPEESVAAASVLSPLNITTISVLDLGMDAEAPKKIGLEGYHFQVATPAEVKVRAAMDILDYVGWRFISVVYDDNVMNRKGHGVLVRAARQKGVCIAVEVETKSSELDETKMDHVIKQLMTAKEQGSRVVVLWTTEETTKKLLTGLGRFLEAGALKRADLVLFGLGGWGEKPDLIKGLENEALGALIFRPQQGEVREFATYFSRLLPDTNERNPWFQKLWLQEQMREKMKTCASGQGCTPAPASNNPVQYEPRLSTVNTIQAVVAVAAGLARLRNEMCQVELGLCPSLLHQQQLRQLIGQYILYTASARQDELGHMFKFSYQGYGDSPIEIYNFRKGSGKSFTYHKVGSYHGRLANLVNMVTYTSEGEVRLDSLASDCVQDCLRCRSSSVGHVVVPSPDHLYIAATLGVHEATSNPLECGPLQPTRGFQNLEAVMWAVDQVNANPQLLPGIHLGIVAFDTCNSRERAAMDVSNFLMETIEDESLPPSHQVVGFVADQTGDVIQPVADVTMPLKMTTIASAAVSTEFNDLERYPYLLRMSLPNNLVTTCIVSLLRYFRWNYVSVLYSDGSGEWSEMFREFRQEAEQQGVKLALVERIVSTAEDAMAATMDIAAHRLKIKQQDGARAVVLLMPPVHVEHLLGAVKRLQQTGRSKVGDFLWLSYANLEVFQMFPDQSLGALALRPNSGRVDRFKSYFGLLNIRNNSRNPWLREYWEKVFNCRGSACYSGLHQSLQQVGFLQDRHVPNTANSVFALARGLDAVVRSLCPDAEREGACSEMRNHPAFREMLFDFTKQATFVGADGRGVKFGENQLLLATFDIYNFRQIENEVQAFVAVGQYDEPNGLSMNTSRARGYNGEGHEVTLFEIPSHCNNSDTCGANGLSASTPMMKIPANQEFVIGTFLPVHKPGSSMFTCSDVIDEDSFQNLLALSYALEMVNGNGSILPEIELGALAFDHCGTKQKAEEQIFSFIASDGALPNKNVGIKPRAVIAALTFGDDIADGLSPIFDSMMIPQIASPVTSSAASLVQRSATPSKTPRAVSTDSRSSFAQPVSQVKVISSLLERFNWRYVNVIHGDNDFGRVAFWNFFEAAKGAHICIAESLQVRRGSTSSDIANHLREQVTDKDARVMVLLLDDPFLTRTVMEGAKSASLFEEYVWIGIEKQKDSRIVARALEGSDVDVFMVKTETYHVPGFKEYFSSFGLGKHNPVPDSWFEEFWQHHFRCQLPDSEVAQRMYQDKCTGHEKLQADKLEQDLYVYHTVQTVNTVAATLHDYLRRYCIHGDAATNLDDCGEDAREILEREIRKAVKGPGAADCTECGPLKTSLGYQVFQVKSGEGHHVYQQVGLWKDDNLALLMDDVSFIAGVKPESVCRSHCRKCRDQLILDPEELTVPKPPLTANFKSVWGIIVSALSVLGVLLVIICAAYFLLSFPVTVGTTVLGYMILFGLLLLYAINFAFIISPTEGTCGVRRFALGLAYAIVFSGMLVKVMNIWRMMGYHGNRLLSDSYHLTSPAALLVIAVGLVIIQIILSTAWLILIPPKTGLYERVWRCNPPTTFEDELIISLVYVMLMLAITFLFSILTWHSSDNSYESRWIFTCCLLVGLVWVVWTLLSTHLPHHYRDATIISANLVCATVVMLCMYLRKVYLYNKLTRDHEYKSKLQSAIAVPNMYGTLSRQTTLSPVSAAHCGPQKLYGSDHSAPSRMALIGNQCDDATSDSSGSVQVQATDLYPLDMYDGGSQFQPGSLQMGGSSLVLDEPVTFAR